MGRASYRQFAHSDGFFYAPCGSYFSRCHPGRLRDHLNSCVMCEKYESTRSRIQFIALEDGSQARIVSKRDVPSYKCTRKQRQDISSKSKENKKRKHEQSVQDALNQMEMKIADERRKHRVRTLEAKQRTDHDLFAEAELADLKMSKDGVVPGAWTHILTDQPLFQLIQENKEYQGCARWIYFSKKTVLTSCCSFVLIIIHTGIAAPQALHQAATKLSQHLQVTCKAPDGTVQLVKDFSNLGQAMKILCLHHQSNYARHHNSRKKLWFPAPAEQHGHVTIDYSLEPTQQLVFFPVTLVAFFCGLLGIDATTSKRDPKTFTLLLVLELVFATMAASRTIGNLWASIASTLYSITRSQRLVNLVSRVLPAAPTYRMLRATLDRSRKDFMKLCEQFSLVPKSCFRMFWIDNIQRKWNSKMRRFALYKANRRTKFRGVTPIATHVACDVYTDGELVRMQKDSSLSPAVLGEPNRVVQIVESPEWVRNCTKLTSEESKWFSSLLLLGASEALRRTSVNGTDVFCVKEQAKMVISVDSERPCLSCGTRHQRLETGGFPRVCRQPLCGGRVMNKVECEEKSSPSPMSDNQLSAFGVDTKRSKGGKLIGIDRKAQAKQNEWCKQSPTSAAMNTSTFLSIDMIGENPSSKRGIQKALASLKKHMGESVWGVLGGDGAEVPLIISQVWKKGHPLWVLHGGLHSFMHVEQCHMDLTFPIYVQQVCDCCTVLCARCLFMNKCDRIN
jgi:hypothetical protein